MDILVVIFFLTSTGRIDSAMSVGVANSPAECRGKAIAAVKEHEAEVKVLVDQGLTPQLHCVVAHSLADYLTTTL